jgi:hypothetical protein
MQLLSSKNSFTKAAQRFISSSNLSNFVFKSAKIEATYQKDNEKVRLRGKFLQGRQPDLPTLIWLSDLLEPSENFQKFFSREDSKILDYRNVWLLNYRNFGDSDHHDSFALDVCIIQQFITLCLSGYVK